MIRQATIARLAPALLCAACMADAPREPSAEDCVAIRRLPAQLETPPVTEETAPASISPDGTGPGQATDETRTKGRGIRPEETLRIPTPCALEAGDPAFLASVQRALAVRGLYDGATTGTLDEATRAAIRAFQGSDLPGGDVLTLESARKLGLIETPRDDL